MIKDEKIVKELAQAIYETMEPLIRFSIEQRLKQILPIIKDGLKK